VAEANVKLTVDARPAVRATNALKAAVNKTQRAVKKLEEAVQRSGRAFKKLGRDAARGLKQIAAAARNAASKMGGFGKAAIAAAAAAGALATLRFAFAKAGELERQTKSLQVLTGSLETANGIIKELQAFGAVTPFESADLIETAKRLKAFGFETEKLVGVTKRLADVAGATGADLNGIATAFGQIQAKGKLQTEELLQLQERGVDIASVLKEEYKLTGEEFSKALQRGQVSAKAVEFALLKLTDAGGKYANGAIAQSDTLFGKLSTLQDAITRLGQNIGKALAPVFKFLIDQATKLVNIVNSAFANIGARREAIQAARDRGLSGGNLRRFINSAEFRQEVERIKKQAAQPTAGGQAEALTLPSLTKPTALAGAGSGRKEKSPEELLQEKLQRLREQAIATDAQALRQQEQREESLNRQVMQLDKQLALLQAGTEEDRKAIERAFQLSELTRGLNDEQAGALAQRLQVRYQEIDALQEQQRKEEQLAEAQKQAAERMAQTYRSIGDAIKTGVVDTLMAAVDQTKSLAEVASNTLRSLANTLLKLGLESAFGALGAGGGLMGKLFGRANGGTVMGGRSYVVGERGPELFTPNRTGSIAPNNAIGGVGNVVVNVDAKGTNVQGDGAEAKQLGDAIGAAVRIELLKQRRPGGLLA
jgi:tape measure domain-containing protein